MMFSFCLGVRRAKSLEDPLGMFCKYAVTITAKIVTNAKAFFKTTFPFNPFAILRQFEILNLKFEMNLKFKILKLDLDFKLKTLNFKLGLAFRSFPFFLKVPFRRTALSFWKDILTFLWLNFGNAKTAFLGWKNFWFFEFIFLFLSDILYLSLHHKKITTVSSGDRFCLYFFRLQG